MKILPKILPLAALLLCACAPKYDSAAVAAELLREKAQNPQTAGRDLELADLYYFAAMTAYQHQPEKQALIRHFYAPQPAAESTVPAPTLAPATAQTQP